MTQATETAGTAATAAKRNAKRTARRAGKKKLAVKLRADKEFAKNYFEAKSKRSTEKKNIFRKKKARKK